MKSIQEILIISTSILLFINWIKCDLKIEVMKEGLLDLKTTILRYPNVTEFSGSAQVSYIGGTIGELVPFFPLDGCSELIHSPPFTEKEEKSGSLQFSLVNERLDGAIVLISRGGCSLNDKFKNVKKIEGVIGVVVFNGPEDVMPSTPDIKLTNDKPDLPGFLVSNSVGLELYNKMIKYRGSLTGSDNNNNQSKVNSLSVKTTNNNNHSANNSNVPYIEITMTPVSIDGSSKANAIIQMALITIIIILALSFGASIVVHMRSTPNTERSSNSDNENDHLAPIDVEFLQKLPLKTYKGRRKSSESIGNGSTNSDRQNVENSSKTTPGYSSSGIKSPTVSDEKSLISPKDNQWFEMVHHDWPMNDSCPICLDEFNQNEVLNELPCGHCYHIACIQPWLQYRSPCCPLCKLDVREEFKPSNPKTSITIQSEESEDDTRSKLRSIWSKLLSKSSNNDATNTRANNNATPPVRSTLISMSELSQLSTANTTETQIPQRALIQDSNDFHTIPL